jgi:hypothetical protein
MPFGTSKTLDTKELRAAAKHRMSLQMYRHLEQEVSLRSGFRKHGLVLSTGEIKATFAEMAQGPLVIVRRYDRKAFGPNAEKRFAEEARIVALHGYFPATQSFADNNALAGVSMGMGTLTVSYARR